MLKLLRDPRGMFLVFMAMIINVILFAILGGVSMVGFLVSNKSHLQSVANVVALAALQDYVENQGSYFEKAEAGLARANAIALKNSLKAAKTPLGGLELWWDGALGSPSENGSVTFGRWYMEAPEDNSDPCGVYPCFKPNTEDPHASLAGDANAVSVKICNQPSTNPIIAPFSKSELFACASAKASIIQRCVGFLMDSSLSTAADSHYSSVESNAVVDLGGGILRLRYPLLKSTRNIDFPTGTYQGQTFVPDPPLPFDEITNPVIAALPSYPLEVQGIDCLDPNQFVPVTSLGVVNTYFREKLFWCSMGQRANPALPNFQRDPSQPINPRLHFQSDYQIRGPAGRQRLVDVLSEGTTGYFAPEPMGASYLGMNAALRSMMQATSGADQVFFLGFSKNIVYRWPQTGVSTDLGFLVKLSNLDNRGTVAKDGSSVTPESHPNLIDLGLFPSTDPSLARSNIPLALDAAISVMQTSCAPNSTKIIFLFSDGFSSCARDFNSGLPTYEPDLSKIPELDGSADLYDYTCGDLAVKPLDGKSKWSHFNQSLWQLKGALGILDQQSRAAVLTKLQANAIKFYPIVAGRSAAAGDYNRTYNGQRMTQDQAAQLGYSSVAGNYTTQTIIGGTTYFPGWFTAPDVDGYPKDAGGWACANAGRPGFYCASGSAALGAVALDSGGRHCALRPKCKPRDVGLSTAQGVELADDITESTACGCNTHNGTAWVHSDCYIQDPLNPAGPRILGPNFWDQGGAWLTELVGKVDPTTKNRFSPLCGHPTWDHSQRCSYYEMTKSEQAVKCASDAVSGMPYILVSEDPT